MADEQTSRSSSPRASGASDSVEVVHSCGSLLTGPLRRCGREDHGDEDCEVAFGLFLEVLIGGLLAGVLYSLVALGFVLIFKASGVFNFAQGSMVLLAGLALVRSLDWLVAKGLPVWAAIVVGLLFAGVIMAITAFLVERYVLRPAGQSGRPDPVHVDHRRHLHPRGRWRRCSSAPTSIRCGCFPTTPGSCSRVAVPRRHPGQQARRLGRP